MRMPSPLAARMASVRAFVLVLCRPSDESQSGLLPYALYSDVMWRHCSSSILAGRAPASFLFMPGTSVFVLSIEEHCRRWWGGAVETRRRVRAITPQTKSGAQTNPSTGPMMRSASRYWPVA